jgi:hypothetical protein
MPPTETLELALDAKAAFAGPSGRLFTWTPASGHTGA